MLIINLSVGGHSHLIPLQLEWQLFANASVSQQWTVPVKLKIWKHASFVGQESILDKVYWKESNRVALSLLVLTFDGNKQTHRQTKTKGQRKSLRLRLLEIEAIWGEQGWRSGESARLPPIPGPGVICGLSLLVLYSAPRGFSPGTPVFPSPQKPKFILIWFDSFIWLDLFGLFCITSNKGYEQRENILVERELYMYMYLKARCCPTSKC